MLEITHQQQRWQFDCTSGNLTQWWRWRGTLISPVTDSFTPLDNDIGVSEATKTIRMRGLNAGKQRVCTISPPAYCL
jgi:hypothetical protein